jgi:hypothetical protein
MIDHGSPLGRKDLRSLLSGLAGQPCKPVSTAVSLAVSYRDTSPACDADACLIALALPTAAEQPSFNANPPPLLPVLPACASR